MPLYIVRLSPAHHANMAFEWNHPDMKLASKVDLLYSKSHSRMRGKGPWKAVIFRCSFIPVTWDIWKAVLGLLFWETMYILIEADGLQYILFIPLVLPCPLLQCGQ